MALLASCSVVDGPPDGSDGPGPDQDRPDTERPDRVGDVITSDTPGPDGDGGNPDPLTVTTEYGPIQGASVTGARAFLGIPYAAPPIGDLRWRPPAAPTAWTETLETTAHGARCAAIDDFGSGLVAGADENCLFLNVWTPVSTGAGAPVMVWLHGRGGSGSSSDPELKEAEALAAATGSVVVTANYRLGPFGLLTLPSLDTEDPAYATSGTYALLDQRFALGWVKRNIALFGGDPDNVTLVGAGTGGTYAVMHLVSPGSTGLFHKTIVHSGSYEFLSNSRDYSVGQSQRLAQTLGCTDAATQLTCLRGKTPLEVLQAIPVGNDFFDPDTIWWPPIDGLEVPDWPANLLAAGQFQKLPVLLGSNRDDGSFFTVFVTLADDQAYTDSIRALVGTGADGIIAAYPSADYATANAALSQVVSDGVFTCPIRRLGRALDAQGVSVYRYSYTHVLAGLPSALATTVGASHGMELPLLFGSTVWFSPTTSLTAEEGPLSTAMMGYWGRFAATGDPNGGDGSVAWPTYDAAGDQHLTLDLTIEAGTGLRSTFCDLWDSTPRPPRAPQ